MNYKKMTKPQLIVELGMLDGRATESQKLLDSYETEIREWATINKRLKDELGNLKCDHQTEQKAYSELEKKHYAATMKIKGLTDLLHFGLDGVIRLMGRK